MALRPRHLPPPYEVMRPHPPTAPNAGSTASGRAAGGATWFARAHQPMVLRLPRGFVLGALGVAVLGVVLAYLAGEIRGYRRAQQELTSPRNSVPSGVAPYVGPGPVGMSPGTGARVLRTEPPGSGQTGARPPLVKWTGAQATDARAEGLNYFVLVGVRARLSEAQAVRLLEFLWSEGVAAEAIKPQNSAFYEVIALEGFPKEDLGSEAYGRLEQRLQQLGRLWRAQQRGNVDFSGMFPAKYGPRVPLEAVITSQREYQP